MQLLMANVGNTFTRFHQCYGSIPDVTCVSLRLFNRIRDWRGLDEESASSSIGKLRSFAWEKQGRWVTRKLNERQLEVRFLALSWDMDEDEEDTSDYKETHKSGSRQCYTPEQSTKGTRTRLLV